MCSQMRSSIHHGSFCGTNSFSWTAKLERNFVGYLTIDIAGLNVEHVFHGEELIYEIPWYSPMTYLAQDFSLLSRILYRLNKAVSCPCNCYTPAYRFFVDWIDDGHSTGISSFCHICWIWLLSRHS